MELFEQLHTSRDEQQRAKQQELQQALGADTTLVLQLPDGTQHERSFCVGTTVVVVKAIVARLLLLAGASAGAGAGAGDKGGQHQQDDDGGGGGGGDGDALTALAGRLVLRVVAAAHGGGGGGGRPMLDPLSLADVPGITAGGRCLVVVETADDAAE